MSFKSVSVRLLGLSIVGTAALWWSVAWANTVTFDPQSSIRSLGETFSLDLIGTGFLDSADGGGVSIAFDPVVLSANSVAVDTSRWEFFSYPGSIDNGAGTITGIEFATFGTPPADFLIATLSFTAVGLGSSPLTLTEYIAGTTGGFGLAGSPQAVSFEYGFVGPGPVVALPAAFWLFLSALGFLVGFRRTRTA